METTKPITYPFRINSQITEKQAYTIRLFKKELDFNSDSEVIRYLIDKGIEALEKENNLENDLINYGKQKGEI